MWRVLQRLCSALLLSLFSLSSCTVFLFDSEDVKSVQITPANPTIIVGGTKQFVANVTFNDGAILQVGLTSLAWASSNPAIASISGTGLATGRGPGTVVITGTFDGVSGSTTLTVNALTQAEVEISGSANKLEVTFPRTAGRFLYVANPQDATVSVSRVNIATNEEQPIDSVSVEPARGPVWMAIHPSGKFLYIADHTSRDISAFSIDPFTGRLTAVPGSPVRAEGLPWSISVDSAGQFLSVTQFEASNVYRFRIDQTTGTLALERWP
jgi:DNA-binding beta-propeller fold protein YncE